MSAGAMRSLGTGGLMAAYALALGANNLEVGIIAALPFITQVMRLPAVLLVELFRARKALGWPAFALMQLVWLPIGLVPLLLDTPGKLAVFLMIAFLGVHGTLNSLWVTTSNTWMRDLIPPAQLASYFGRRLAMVTIAISVIGPGRRLFRPMVGEHCSARRGGFRLFVPARWRGRRLRNLRRVCDVPGHRAHDAPVGPIQSVPGANAAGAAAGSQLFPAHQVPVRVEPDLQPGDTLLRHLYAEGHWPLAAGGHGLDRVGPDCPTCSSSGCGGVSRTGWGAKRCYPCRRHFTCWSSSAGCSPSIPSVIFSPCPCWWRCICWAGPRRPESRSR